MAGRARASLLSSNVTQPLNLAQAAHPAVRKRGQRHEVVSNRIIVRPWASEAVPTSRASGQWTIEVGLLSLLTANFVGRPP
jgi:hypothetical protein